MANDNSLQPEQKLTPAPPSASDPALVYEAHCGMLYGLIRLYLSEPYASDTIRELAGNLISRLASTGYKKYAKLISLKEAFELITKNSKAKSPLPISEADCFALLLRDRFGLPCIEIASVIDCSEGSVRTRLDRVRAKLTKRDDNISLTAGLARSKNQLHRCIETRDEIEDWNPSSSRIGKFEVPQFLSRATQDCPRCQHTLENRLQSLDTCYDLALTLPPEELQAFPVTPLFVKEGNRLLLNWSSAPWYIKAIFEGLLATSLVLGVVLSIPRIKGLYEYWLERRLDLYSVAELATGLSSSSDSAKDTPTESAPSTNTQTTNNSAESTQATQTSPADIVAATTTGQLPITKNKSDDPLLALETKPAAPASTTPSPQSMKGKPNDLLDARAPAPTSNIVYRVLLKTDSTETMKAQVFQILQQGGYVAADPDDASATGADLPGGILFDGFVPLKNFRSLVNEIGRLSNDRRIIQTPARERGQAGKTRLKIWLQRI